MKTAARERKEKLYFCGKDKGSRGECKFQFTTLASALTVLWRLRALVQDVLLVNVLTLPSWGSGRTDIP